MGFLFEEYVTSLRVVQTAVEFHLSRWKREGIRMPSFAAVQKRTAGGRVLSKTISRCMCPDRMRLAALMPMALDKTSNPVNLAGFCSPTHEAFTGAKWSRDEKNGNKIAQ